MGIIFLLEVWKYLIFPKFDPYLLTLQGISAGTYLGLKLPEKPKSSNNELLKELKSSDELSEQSKTSDNHKEDNTSESLNRRSHTSTIK